MDRNNEPNSDKDHNTRAATWKEIFLVYGLLIAALACNWIFN